jgi:para-aminobenzoate synthetase/4-amino-4-deoxychorismate lyase
VLLWNKEGYFTETSIANVDVQIEDKLLTPPVNCRLLAGTFRGKLLETGEATECKIHVSELATDQEIVLFNSVRGRYSGLLHDI